MMKTIPTGWSQTARRHTLYLFAIFTLLGTFLLPSCRDEELIPTPHAQGANAGVSRADGNSASGLVQNEDGTWTATRRVPLVGAGRVVNSANPSLVEVGGYADASESMVDTDLENAFSPSSVLGLQIAANEIAAIRDLNYEYAGKQKAGFVLEKGDGSILNVDVLKNFWVTTYLRGERRDSVTFGNASSVLDLSLGNISGGNAQSTFVVESTFNQSFDEIRFGMAGISAEVLSSVKVRYAYVGENPIIPAVNDGNAYFNNNVSAPTGVDWASYANVSLKKLVNPDLEDGVLTSFLIIGLFQPYLTVDFGRDVPAGSEVGFYMTSGTAANVAIADVTTIQAYDSQGNKTDDNYSSADVVGLEVLGGSATYFSMTLKESCRRLKISFNGLNILDVGGSMVHYAYVREKTEVDISSYFTLSNATVYNQAYRFADLPEGYAGKVKYELVQAPNRADSARVTPYEAGNILENMNIAGDYLVKGTLTTEDGTKIERYATITRVIKNLSNCSSALTNENETDNTYEAYAPEGFNGVIQVGTNYNEGELKFVTDKDPTNYLSLKQVSINVAQDYGIIGVRKKNGKINPEGHNVRVGFVINRTQTVLGANVLNFLRIKLKNNGEEVASGVGKDNNGVSLSLIGTATEGQARLSIETEEVFDEIELYSSGLLSADLGSSLNIYYAFSEEVEEDCGEPGEECMQLITNANYGAVATVHRNGVADVISVFQNIGNIVDGDKESYATIFSTLNAGNAMTLSVKFNDILPNQEVGLILSGVTGLANLGLINIEIIQVLKDGEVVAKTSSGSGVGLKVAGDGDKSYLSITPTTTFDELQVVFGEGVDALKTLKIHGIYIRPDYDGDGIMDCINDQASTAITGLHAEPTDICEGDAASFKVDGGVEGVTYQLQLSYEENDNWIEAGDPVDVTINSSGRLDFGESNKDFISRLEPHQYQITIIQDENVEWNGLSDNTIYFTVHPDETTWTGRVSGDWNEWDNWTNGTPYTCTNVILPSPEGSTLYEGNVTNYPVLTSEAYCNHIHFETGAELINQHLLTYTQAFVDMEIQGGGYRLMSAPLRSMATGDMFVMENYESSVGTWEAWRKNLTDGLHTNYFTPVSDSGTSAAEGKYGVQRTSPCVYQRFWSSAVRNVTMTRTNGYPTSDKAIVEQTDWSRSFNSVSDIYSTGQGFAVKIDGNQAYRLHFPKSIVQYDYVTSGGNPTGTSGSVNRTYLGKLAKEDLSDIVLYRESEGTKFLFGNPFMAHINVDAFFEANERITSIDVYDGTGYVTVQRDGTASADGYSTQIAPMEAVFLNVADPALSLEVHVDGEGLLSKDNGTAGDNSFSYQLRMTASRNGRSASCVVVKLQSASDGYRPEEDATLLAGSEEAPEAAVYTVADRKALSIQRVNGAARIPVGFCMKRTDTQTGRSYPLEGTVSLDNVADGTGRFYLEKR